MSRFSLRVTGDSYFVGSVIEITKIFSIIRYSYSVALVYKFQRKMVFAKKHMLPSLKAIFNTVLENWLQTAKFHETPNLIIYIVHYILLSSTTTTTHTHFV